MKRPEEPPGEAPSETSPAPSAGRRAQWRRGAAGLFAFLGLVGAGACHTGDPRGQPGPLGGGDTPGTTGVGGGADGGEACAEPGARRDCKVDINAQNCLEGAQVCENGRWGSCLPDAPLEGARGEWQAASLGPTSLGPPAPCTGNPCNPVCQAFDEDPAPDLEATGTPPPPNAAGTIDDAPAAIKNACIDDTTTTCGNNCTSTGYCQFDTRCLTPPGSTCVPWQDGQFDTGAGDPDFTIKVGCDSSVVTVCNRGDAPGGNGVGISVWTPNPALCGGSSGCQGALKTGLAAAAGESARGTCTIPSNIAPGDCAAVPCDLSGHPASLVHVNGCDEFACVSESDQDNNWGYYDNSVGCTCAAATAGSAPSPRHDVSDVGFVRVDGEPGPVEPRAKRRERFRSRPRLRHHQLRLSGVRQLDPQRLHAGRLQRSRLRKPDPRSRPVEQRGARERAGEFSQRGHHRR
ncbi:MAG: hypothetical protein AAF928_09055 [Myxococcota bacterium]